MRRLAARDDVFVVSKVYPHNASARGRASPPASAASPAAASTTSTCYLLHWRGGVPLQETVDGFETLRTRGRIRHWGVSNFDVDDMDELMAVPGGDALRDQPGLLLAEPSAARSSTCCRGMQRARHADDGLFADRPGRAGAQRGAARRWRPSEAASPGAAGACLARRAARRDGDPEGRERGAPARELRRRRRSTLERCRHRRARCRVPAARREVPPLRD